MIFNDLQVGDYFTLEGERYEVQRLGERIILAYVLCLEGSTDGTAGATWQRIPDPNDLTGDKFQTTAFSDLRFNREHSTPEDAARFEDLL